jgi:hypothetical protein
MTSPAERSGALASALLGKPGVTLSWSRGFSRDSLMGKGKLFAAVRGEVLMLKLPADRWRASSPRARAGPLTPTRAGR